LDGENKLIKQDLIEIIPTAMTTDTECQLTDKAYQILRDSGLNLKKFAEHRKDIIKPHRYQRKGIDIWRC
jgi:peptidase E